MKCFKINFGNCDKWVACEGDAAEDIVKAIKQKINLKDEDNIFMRDEDNAEIDPDVLPYYSSSQKNPYLKIYTEETIDLIPSISPLGRLSDFNLINAVGDADELDNSTPSTSSVSTISLSTCSSESKLVDISGKILNTLNHEQDLRIELIEHGGHYILREYEKNNILSDRLRIHFVNIVANILFERYGTNVPKTIKMEYAKKMIEIFPVYKNRSSTIGGYPDTKPILMRLEGNFSQTEQNIMEEKMGELNKCEDIEKIRILTKETFVIRKEMKEKSNLMKIFPKFRQISGLVQQEFELMFPQYESFVESFKMESAKVIEICERKKRIHISEISLEYSDLYILCSLALMKMVPPSPKGRKSVEGGNLKQIFNKLLVFQQTTVPITETIAACSNKQPYIIARGSKEDNLDDFHIVLDSNILPDTFSDFVSALEYIFMTHFVFDIKYDSLLENFYKFLHFHYFKSIQSCELAVPASIIQMECLMNAD